MSHFRIITLSFALLLWCSGVFGDNYSGNCTRRMTFLGFTSFDKAIDARGRNLSLAPFFQYAFENQFPKGAIKFEDPAANSLSKETFKLIQLKFNELKAKKWPYGEAHAFFYLAINYMQLKYGDGNIIELESLNRFASAKKFYSFLKNIPPDDYAWLKVALDSNQILLPMTKLSTIDEMNHMGGWGIHPIIFTASRRNIDGNPYEEPMTAYGHDLGHFAGFNKNPDYHYWRKLVDAINALPDDMSRKAMHLIFFSYWHEQNHRVSRPLLAKYLLGLHDLDSWQTLRDSDTFFPPLRISKTKLQNAIEKVLSF